MNNIDPVELTKGLPGIPCPIAKTLDVISTKWTFLIIRDLLIEGTLRFSDLQNQWMGLVKNIIASTKIRIARHYNEKSISRSSASCRVHING